MITNSQKKLLIGIGLGLFCFLDISLQVITTNNLQNCLPPVYSQKNSVIIILGVSANSNAGDSNYDPNDPNGNPDGEDFLPWDSIGKAFLVCVS